MQTLTVKLIPVLLSLEVSRVILVTGVIGLLDLRRTRTWFGAVSQPRFLGALKSLRNDIKLLVLTFVCVTLNMVVLLK